MEEKIDILRTKISKMPKGREKVDALNELSWLVRYERSEEGVQAAAEARSLSGKINYKRGGAYGKLNSAANRYLSALDEEVIRLLFEALDYFDHSVEKEAGLSQAHNFLAMVHESYGDYETALKHAQHAVDAASSMNYKEGEGDGLSTLGLIHNRLCDFSRSLPVFKKSIEIRKELGNNKAVASSLNLIARTYALSGEYEPAMDHYTQSLELREEINDESGLPWTYLGMASLLEKAGTI
ncbi:tetratricopeptide repeat protein [Bacteroidota bacterium]